MGAECELDTDTARNVRDNAGSTWRSYDGPLGNWLEVNNYIGQKNIIIIIIINDKIITMNVTTTITQHFE